MRKVKVEKEMPFAKVGEEKPVEGQSIRFNSQKITGKIKVEELDDLVEAGWLSWVEEEKTLKQKMREYCLQNEQFKNVNYAVSINTAIKIAKEHYLKVFDKASNDTIDKEINMREVWSLIRKALEEA